MLRYEGEAEWERRKAYLIRSMIAFPSALSPIREEPVEIPSSAEVTAQIEAEGPLPDLIIERAYKRHHDDESDEYYDKFSKKIMRYYKKHILKQEVDDDASSFNESLVGIDTTDVNFEEDISFMKFKNRRQEIYSEDQSLSVDDLESVGNNTREFGDTNNDLSDRNQHAAERDIVENQLGTNKDGDSRISKQLKYRCDGSFEATISGTNINPKSRGDVIDNDATEILERLQYSKSSDDEESSTKVDDKEKNSALSYNLGDRCVIPVNLESLTGFITKSRSVEDLTAPKSPLIQTRIPDISHLLNESTSDERERPIASSTPIEEYNFLETITEVQMILDQDASKYLNHEGDIQHNNTERMEAEKNHTSHEDTDDVEDHNIRHENHGHPDPEIEVMRSVHTSSQRLSIECQTSSSNTDSSVPDFNTALYLSFESIRNSNNGMDAIETSIINDNFPRISAMERISLSENEKSRVGLKRVFSFPEYSTKRFKSVNTQTNEIAKQHKHAFVQTAHTALLVNVVTQAEEMPKTNIDIQTQVDRQVKTVQIQTEEAATNNVEIQTEIREANMIDSESQTDDFLEGRWHRYCNYYENNIKFYFF